MSFLSVVHALGIMVLRTTDVYFILYWQMISGKAYTCPGTAVEGVRRLIDDFRGTRKAKLICRGDARQSGDACA